ncbi:B-cell CLL/lymphoma 6 member B protein [Eucyclogobius newberryi]|uniref:B-cell CLL/lymphoma 6 member B protein n=1 Tax=Eucyclogobius newberryi TaxID=166745 RepID=UPI003B592161
MDMQEEYRAEGYVKEFTRHSTDVLLNLNELRHRNILTDATLVVGSRHLQAHCAVLVACSGFFYSLYSSRVFIHSGSRETLLSVSLPSTLDPSSVSLLLDFMYTSRLPLTPSIAPGVLAVATYLQMDHVAETCRDFILHCRESIGNKSPDPEPVSRVFVTSAAAQAGALPHPGLQLKLPVSAPVRIQVEGGISLKQGISPKSPTESKGPNRPPDTLLSPDSPARSSCQPSSPAESNTCSKNLVSESNANLDPKACNWKKYKYIILNPLLTETTVKEEERFPDADRTTPKTKTPVEAWPGEVPGQMNRQGRASCYEGSGRAPPLGPPTSVDKSALLTAHTEGAAGVPIKTERSFVPFCYSGNSGVTKTTFSSERPYRCDVCGAQFNRPANLKTHARIHSGEKPYRCDTCGARFVQVAHLRAHVLIHTGEKPYPCHTCGTRFRHLQTLKSHLRIHTGEKPYSCEKCDLHFRHKSQLRLHLRQKHGAITNSKIRYKLLTEPYQPLLQTNITSYERV